MDHPLAEPLWRALGEVNDPEIHRSITSLGMVDQVMIAEDNSVTVRILLTVAGCPMKATLTEDVTAAASGVPGVESVQVDLGVMTDEQRANLRDHLTGGAVEREVPFAKPSSLTRVIAIASGKGGVGKSSVTVNLALALANRGLTVGVLDADIYGHSVPPMLGIADARPTVIEDMIMPVPALGLKVMSIGMLKEERGQVVAWRGPILDRALRQMLADVYWGDLDVLLLDLPPGTGDVAISLGQRLPNADVVVVTTPQESATEVAERAGTMAGMMNQRVVGVVENMAWLETPCPHCGEPHRVEVFGSGGGERTAQGLSATLGYEVPLLAQIPLELAWREGSDEGVPVVATDPERPSARALTELAASLVGTGRGLLGKRLDLSPN
ncbi:Mrp/NBP35 family ATP-binding protein [Parenemella sanctibonifatiensis]|uniref:Iron-sulfur cluster carrier protein n=1 Tax=Parenemella sanctibonifatiensis TaxID=2016505 RepID=A0A255EEK5_9ACTN|nr:P-loop NTPase [Parenemella sanctibonifatiensis]OYN89660.1 sodium:proton antiporter [Parenemella sanctibonifatiensis]